VNKNVTVPDGSGRAADLAAYAAVDEHVRGLERPDLRTLTWRLWSRHVKSRTPVETAEVILRGLRDAGTAIDSTDPNTQAEAISHLETVCVTAITELRLVTR
jgi:hypothetical protein